MKATDRYGFPYPEPEDFGDGSTQLANLAYSIDAELQGRIDAFNDVLRPPTYIRGRSSTINFTNSTDFQEISWNLDVYSSDTLNPASTALLKVPSPGIYHAGLFVWLNAVGAVTANSMRRLLITVFDRRGPTLNDQVSFNYEQSTLEAATGIANTVHAVFAIYTPEYVTTGVRASLQHDNVASQMRVETQSYFWVSRLGDLVT